jgi:nitrogen-specific signal transduction histidine kinase
VLRGVFEAVGFVILAVTPIALSSRPWAMTNWLPHPHNGFFDTVYVALDPRAFYLVTGLITFALAGWPRNTKLSDCRSNWRAAGRLLLRALVILVILTPVLVLIENVLKYGVGRARPITRIEHTIIAAQIEGWLPPEFAAHVNGNSFQCPVGRLVFDPQFGVTIKNLGEAAREEAIVDRLVQSGLTRQQAGRHVRDIRRRTGIGPNSIDIAKEIESFHVIEPWRALGKRPFLTGTQASVWSLLQLSPRWIRRGLAPLLPEPLDKCSVRGAAPSGHVIRQGFVLFLFLIVAYFQVGPKLSQWPSAWKLFLGLQGFALALCIWSRIYGYEHTWSDEMMSFSACFVVLGTGRAIQLVMMTSERRLLRIFKDAGSTGILEPIRLLVMVTDRDGTIILWNREAARVTGYDHNEIGSLDDYASKLFGPTEVPRVLQRKLQATPDTSNESGVFEYITAKDRRPRLIRWGVTPLTEADGEVFGRLHVGYEVSRFDRHLADIGAGLVSLLHDIAHQVGTAKREAAREGLVLPALQRIEDMCDDFRSYAKRGADLRRPINTNDFLRDVLFEIYEEAQEAGVKLETAVDADLPYIFGNQYVLKHAITDLLRNAIRAASTNLTSDSRAEVRISATVTEEAQGDLLKIEIADTGIGLSDKLRTWLASGPLYSDFTDDERDVGLGLLLANSCLPEGMKNKLSMFRRLYQAR